MKSFTEHKYKEAYNKVEHDIANDFYIPTMSNSLTYLRLSGYFGSTVFIIAWAALKEFINNGGHMKIICSPCLSDQDISAIQSGEAAKTDDIIRNSLHEEIQSIINDNYLSRPFKVLSYLIANNILEIKIAYGNVFVGHKRLFHDKVGLFFDNSDNSVMFRGSLNETFKGLSNDGNFESIDVFTSWNNDENKRRIRTAHQYFDKLWNNEADGMSVINLPDDIKATIKANVPKESWETLLSEINTSIDETQAWAADKSGKRLPRRHQLESLKNWVKAGHKGVLEHATGSGKTYTCLCAIRKALLENKSVLILVPSTDLLTQWYDDVKETLKDLSPTILLCGNGNNHWKKDGVLSFMTGYHKEKCYITISTMDTAITKAFLYNISQGEHLFVVADEVHRMGSYARRSFFSIHVGYRLGVSATPRRYGDPEGTDAIFKYFGDIVPPVYTLADAINDKVLTPYFYMPTTVSLSETEQEEWSALTKKIKERYARFSKSPEALNDDTYFQTLLLNRARIIKKAEAKVDKAIEILKDNYEPGSRWIVYCEDIHQLKVVLARIESELPSIDVIEYYADMVGDRKAALDYFTNEGGVIVSIKCLDEGVDIPATTHAIILASSKNPREFIQRRGRILRKAPNKKFSHLYDVLVEPFKFDDSDLSTDKLLLNEISRAIEFAELAHTSYGLDILKLYAIKNKINIKESANKGHENDDE